MNKVFDYNPHEEYMARAIDLAKKGHGSTSPNPMVGCVIVMDGEIIGEGYHKGFGEDHAEVVAFNNSVKLPMDVSVYINLEPCSIYGKTPPCTDVLLKNSVKEIYIGCLDPNMNKEGLEVLRKSGIKIQTGILEERCIDLNKGFLNIINYKRPWTIAKLAQSSEGYIGIDSNQSIWITGEQSKIHTHQLRGEVDAILIGRQTALVDNPKLTVREVIGENPKRLVLDTDRKLPMNLNIFNQEDQKTIIFCSNRRFQNTHTEKYQYVAVEEYNERLSPASVIDEIVKLGINSLLIEGGAEVIKSFMQFNLIDEVYIYTAPKSLSGAKLKNPIILDEDWVVTSEKSIGKDQLMIARKKEECLQEL